MKPKLQELLKKEWFKQLATLFFVVGLIWGGIASAKWFGNELESRLAIKKEIAVSKDIAEKPKEEPVVAPKEEAPAPKEEIKKEITKKPPQKSAAGKITGSTTTNTDGSKTTVVSSEGTASPTDFAKAADAGPSGPTPTGVNFTDETGQYASLKSTLLNYMTNQLRWSNEISSLYQITVRDAGDTGWSGQYNGTYTINQSGDITSAYGFIILNTYYYKDEANFEDYMKWVLAHEYGHHYTLYYRWVNWDIPAGQRFPDEYYNTRPLSKDSTASDYSKGWQNCDAEIIAEDYTYFYSGYGIQQMNSIYGLPLPSAATKTWIQNLVSGPGTPAAVVDNPPTISILEPADSTLSGAFALKVTAADDNNITKVNFYVDSTLAGEDTTAPFEVNLQTGSYSGGEHTLKAVAYDSANQTAEKTVVVAFDNKLKVSFLSPESNPHEWSSGDLLLRAKTDLGEIVKMELYLNGYLSASEDNNEIARMWPYGQGPAGTYTLKVRGYDIEGNYAESSITINKH